MILEKIERMLADVTAAFADPDHPPSLCPHGTEAAANGCGTCLQHPRLGLACPDCLALEHAARVHGRDGRIVCLVCEREPALPEFITTTGNITALNTTGRMETSKLLVWEPLCRSCRRLLAGEMIARIADGGSIPFHTTEE